MKPTSILNKQARKFKTVLKSRQVARHDIAATMGNGAGVLNVAGESNLIWVVIQGKPYKAFCAKVSSQNGKDVWVGRQIVNGKETGYYEVLSERAMSSAHSEIINRSGYASASRYHWTGEDPLMVELRAYLPLRIGISETGGMMVDLYRGIVETDTERFLIERQDIDVSVHIPTTVDKTAFVLITINDSGNVIQTKGAEVNIDTQVLADIPMPPAGTIFESGAVRVYYGQTRVQEGRRQTSRNTDLVDLRLGRNIFTGGGASPGGSNTQLQFNNSGVFGGLEGVVWDIVNRVLTIGGEPEGTGGASEGLDLIGKGDELPTRLRMFAYGNTVAPVVRFFRAGGTRLVKTALAIGKTLGGIEGIGTDDGGGWTSLLGRVIIRTSEALTTLAHGTEIAFLGTPKGSTTLTEFGKVDEYGFNVPMGATYNIGGIPLVPATTTENDFQVGDGLGAWVKKTLAQTIAILGIFADAASDSIYYVRRNATWTNAKTYFDTVYAAISHTHAAEDVTSGVMATARLGSGTADGTKLLAGDNTWVNKPTAETNAVDIFRCNTPGGASTFVGTILGTPLDASVVYNITSGFEGALVPNSTSQLAKLRLYNTTRGNYALILNCNTTTKTITLTATVPIDWVNGDTITIASQTVTGSGHNMVDLEITSGVNGRTSLFISMIFTSSAANDRATLHPFETFSASKYKNIFTQAASIINEVEHLMKINSNVLSMFWTGNPSFVILRESGFL